MHPMQSSGFTLMTPLVNGTDTGRAKHLSPTVLGFHASFSAEDSTFFIETSLLLS
jgi:hypothetical protein